MVGKTRLQVSFRLEHSEIGISSASPFFVFYDCFCSVMHNERRTKIRMIGEEWPRRHQAAQDLSQIVEETLGRNFDLRLNQTWISWTVLFRNSPDLIFLAFIMLFRKRTQPPKRRDAERTRWQQLGHRHPRVVILDSAWQFGLSIEAISSFNLDFLLQCGHRSFFFERNLESLNEKDGQQVEFEKKLEVDSNHHPRALSLLHST